MFIFHNLSFSIQLLSTRLMLHIHIKSHPLEKLHPRIRPSVVDDLTWPTIELRPNSMAQAKLKLTPVVVDETDDDVIDEIVDQISTQDKRKEKN